MPWQGAGPSEDVHDSLFTGLGPGAVHATVAGRSRRLRLPGAGAPRLLWLGHQLKDTAPSLIISPCPQLRRGRLVEPGLCPHRGEPGPLRLPLLTPHQLRHPHAGGPAGGKGQARGPDPREVPLHQAAGRAQWHVPRALSALGTDGRPWPGRPCDRGHREALLLRQNKSLPHVSPGGPGPPRSRVQPGRQRASVVCRRSLRNPPRAVGAGGTSGPAEGGPRCRWCTRMSRGGVTCVTQAHGFTGVYTALPEHLCPETQVLGTDGASRGARLQLRGEQACRGVGAVQWPSGALRGALTSTPEPQARGGEAPSAWVLRSAPWARDAFPGRTGAQLVRDTSTCSLYTRCPG